MSQVEAVSALDGEVDSFGLRSNPSEIFGCADFVNVVSVFSVAPSAVLELKAAVLNHASVKILWHEPNIKNGSLDGYVVEITGETDSAVRLNPTADTAIIFVYNKTDKLKE